MTVDEWNARGKNFLSRCLGITWENGSARYWCLCTSTVDAKTFINEVVEVTHATYMAVHQAAGTPKGVELP